MPTSVSVPIKQVQKAPMSDLSRSAKRPPASSTFWAASFFLRFVITK